MKKPMKIKHFLFNRLAIQELLLIFFLVLLVNNYFKNDKLRIAADGKGYYDYLPAFIVYNDLNFNYIDTLITDLYRHHEDSKGYLPTVEGKRINKYFVGTAISQAPFFLLAHNIALLNDHKKADGYSAIYQDFIFYAALFYTFLGLLFLRKILQIFGTDPPYVFILQATSLFAGSLMYYINSQPAFSHPYSFGFINLFLYLILRFSRDQKLGFVYMASLVLGIIMLIRPVNGLILAFVPFMFSNLNDFWNKLIQLLKLNWKDLLAVVFITLAIVSIQPIVWYLQTGHYFVNSYQGEGFILSQPNIIKFLFSFQKGLFVYAPAFFILIVAGLATFLYERNFWKIVSFFIPFVLTSYILSSWWVWYYGASFGSRVMIDYYGLMIIFGSSFFRIKSNLIKLSLSALLVLGMYIAVVQTYQYKYYILSRTSMSFDNYLKVFLKTDSKYHGILLHKEYHFTSDQIIYSSITNDIDHIEALGNGIILIDSTRIQTNTSDQGNYILQIGFNASFEEGTDQVAVRITDSTGKYLFSASRYLIFGTLKESFDGDGIINFEIDHIHLNNTKLEVLIKKNEPASILRKIQTKLIVNRQTNRP